MQDIVHSEWPEKIEKILLIIVMHSEADPVIKKFGFTKQEDSHPIYTLYKANLESKEIFLIMGKKCLKYDVDPVGSDQATLLTQLGIETCKPDLVISAGTCGGIIYQDKQENVKQYDVCLVKKAFFFDREMIIDSYKPFITSDYPLLDLQRVAEQLSLKKVVCGTTNSFTKDNTLARKHNVDIVEMEAAAESRACFLNKVPFAAIKIVSDVEMDDADERQKAFLQFLQDGPQKLADTLYQIVSKVESFKI